MKTDPALVARQDEEIVHVIRRDEPRLRRFVRSRVFDPQAVDDILQDVFSELIEAYRLLEPAEQVTAWLFRVTRNRITDLFRKRKTVSLEDLEEIALDENSFEDLLPSSDAGPDAAFARGVLIDALEEALQELAPEQREVFMAHEIEGRSFKQLSEETGLSINTLLSRKRYAVHRLRARLQNIKDEYDFS